MYRHHQSNISLAQKQGLGERRYGQKSTPVPLQREGQSNAVNFTPNNESRAWRNV